MKTAIIWAVAIAGAVAFLIASLHWFFRGEDLRFEKSPDGGHALMAAYLDKAAEQIAGEEGLDRNAHCLRAPLWREQYDDGCVLVRPALAGRWRQCTPYRAHNGGCYAIEMRQSLLQHKRIRDLLFARAADICVYRSTPSPHTIRSAHSIDCLSPGDEFEMVRRIEPMLCVLAVDEREEPTAPAIAIRRGRQVQDYWCREWEKLVRARSLARPRDCWLGVRRPAPGGGTFGACRRD
jgi:hypothetical protein